MKNTYFSVKPGAKGSEFYGGGNSQGLSDKGTKYQGTRDQVPSGKGLRDQVPSTNYRTTSVECSGNHPVITLLSPRNHPLLGSGGQVVTDRGEVLAERRGVLADRRDVVAMMRQKCMMWKYVAMLLAVLVLSVGNIGTAWGTDVTLNVSVTSSTTYHETFSDGSVLYVVDSNGREKTSSGNFSECDIISGGVKTTGAAIYNDNRFVVKFPFVVTNVVAYAYNSSTGRTLNALSHATTMGKGNYTGYNTSTEVTLSTSSTTPNYSYTFTAAFASAVSANTYLWFGISNKCNIYKIVYTSPAPTAVAASSITSDGATLTVTDALNKNNYEFYISESSTAPSAGASATHSVSGSKTKVIDDLSAGTTYYCWVRSNFGDAGKTTWTALTGNTFTTEAAAAACTAPSSVSVAPTTEDGNYGWRYTTGDILKLTATATGSSGGDYIYQWKKKTGDSTWKDLADGEDATDGGTFSGATAANLVISGLTSSNAGTYKCVVSTGAGCSTESNEYWVRVFTLDGNYSGEDWIKNPIVWTDEYNGTATVTLDANSVYQFKVTDNDSHWYGLTSPDIYKDEDNFVIYRNDANNVALHTGKVAGTYTFTVNVFHANDNETPKITLTAVRYPKMTIYMSGGESSWCSADPVFFAHTYGRANNDVKMTKHSCEDIYYADVPSYNTNVVFTRQTPGSESIAWSGDNFWNKSDEITIGSNNKFTCTGWNETPEPDQGSFSGSVYSPTTYTVSAAASDADYGTVSAASVTGVACGTSISASTNTLSVGATNVTATPAAATDEYTYAFDNWAWTPAGATVTSDVTATATFTRTPKSYTLTWLTDGDALTGTYTSGSVAYGTPITQPDTPTKTGYTFAGWSSDVASTMPAANTTYTATWTAKQYSIAYKDKDNVALKGDTLLSSPKTHTYGTATALKKASRDGYVFKGWYTNSACTGDPITSLTATDYTADITLYADWDAMTMLALADNTLYKVEDMVPDGVTMDNKNRWYPGVSANNRFNIRGSNSSASKATGGMCPRVEESVRTIDGVGFTNVYGFRKPASGTDGTNLGTGLPDNHAIQFKISGDGLLDIYCYYADSIFMVKDGGSAVVLSASNSAQKVTKEVTEGTYYLYSTRTSSHQRLYGLKFTPTYSVTYKKNGGASGTDGSVTGSVPTDATAYESGQRPVVKGPGDLALEDHIFAGWNDKADGTGTYYSEKSNFAITADKTLYAVWRDISETTCPDGSSEATLFSLSMNNKSTETEVFSFGDCKELSGDATITNGAASYTDIRTSDSPSGTKASIVKANPGQLKFGGNDAMLTLYLDCELAEGDVITVAGTDLAITTTPTRATTIATSSNTLTIEASPAASNALKGKNVLYLWRSGGSTVSATGVTITRPATGYDVNIADMSHGSVSASPSKAAEDATVTLTVTPDTGYELSTLTVTGDKSSSTITVISNEFTMPAEDVTVAATFTAKTYTISFDDQSATTAVSPSSVTATYNSSTLSSSITNPSKTGYTFGGWYKSTGGAGGLIISTGGALQASTDYTGAGGIWTNDGGVTLYAKWTANVYTVTLNKDGGTINPGNNVTSYTYGVGATLPTDVTKSGYVFGGWYDNSGLTGDAVTTIADDATGNKEYWAKWTALSSIPCLDLTELVEAEYWDGDKTYDDAVYEFTEVGDTEEGPGWELGEPARDDEANYIHIGALGIIKEVKLTIEEVGASNADASKSDKGISYYFGEEGEVHFATDEYKKKDDLTAGTLSLRPTSGDFNAFVFKPMGTSLRISNICIYYTDYPVYRVSYNAMGGTCATSSETTVLGKVTLPSATNSTYDLVWVESDGTEAGAAGDKYKTTSDVTLYAKWSGSCAGASTGSTIFKARILTSGMTSNKSAIDALSTNTALTTDNYLSELSGGTFTLNLTAAGKASVANDSTISIVDKGKAYFSVTLSGTQKFQKGDIVTIGAYNNDAYIQKTTDYSMTTDWREKCGTRRSFVIPSSLVGENTFYIKAVSNPMYFAYIDVYRPGETLFFAEVNNGVGTSGLGDGTNETEHTAGAVGEGNTLAAISGGKLYTKARASGYVKGATNEIQLTDGASETYIKLSLDKALAAGDKIIVSTSTTNYPLGVTTSGTYSTTNTVPYTIPAESGMIGEKTIYLWRNSSSSNMHSVAVIRHEGGSSCYTVTYDGNGATGGYTNDPIAYEEDDDPTVLSNGYTRTGYAFIGWCTMAVDDGTGTWYQPGDVIEDIDDDVTLYAIWKQIKYFTGAASTTSWNTDGNWSPSGVPAITDPVVIQEDVTVDTDEAQALSVDIESGNTLTINAGQALIIEKTLTKAGGVTAATDVIINSTRGAGTGALIIGSHAGTNQATVNFESKVNCKSGDVNQYIGSPFSDEIPYVDYAIQMYKFAPTGTGSHGWWNKISYGDRMDPFMGYNLLTNDKSIDFLDLNGRTGHLNASSNMEMTIANGKMYYNSSWPENMFANGWLAPIHIDQFVDDDFVNVKKVIYIFNAGTPEQYEAVYGEGANSLGAESRDEANEAPGTYTVIPVKSASKLAELGAVTKVIPSMQAFSVLATNSSPELKLNFKRLVYDPAKTAVDGGTSIVIEPTRAPRRMASDEDRPDAMRIRVRGENGWTANAYVLGREDFTDGYDDGWDGEYMEGDWSAPQLYSPTGDGSMVVNCVPEIEGTVIAFHAGSVDNNYTFSFVYNGENTWYLNDLREQKSVRIDAAQTYSFASASGDAAARFIISKTPIALTPTGTGDIGDSQTEHARKVIIDDHVYIIRNGKMYNATGSLVK